MRSRKQDHVILHRVILAPEINKKLSTSCPDRDNMKDIPKWRQSFKFLLYVDDTSLFTAIEYSIATTISNISELLNELNEINMTGFL